MIDVAACDWSRPGADPFWGKSSVEAIESYGWPKMAREMIVEKIVRGEYDGVATITFDSAEWNGAPIELHDMHWGRGRCTGPVRRSAWNMFRVERALIYCGGPGRCIAVPFICGNISRIEFGVASPRRRLNGDAPRPPWVGEVPGAPHNVIPTPSSLLLALAALAGIGVVRRQGKP